MRAVIEAPSSNQRMAQVKMDLQHRGKLQTESGQRHAALLPPAHSNSVVRQVAEVACMCLYVPVYCCYQCFKIL